MKFIWLEDEQLVLGTLTDYARTWKSAHERGYGQPSVKVRTWDDTFEVTVEDQGADIDGQTRYELSVCGETVFVHVDG